MSIAEGVRDVFESSVNTELRVLCECLYILPLESGVSLKRAGQSLGVVVSGFN